MKRVRFFAIPRETRQSSVSDDPRIVEVVDGDPIEVFAQQCHTSPLNHLEGEAVFTANAHESWLPDVSTLPRGSYRFECLIEEVDDDAA